MSSAFTTLAISGVVAVVIAAFLRQRGWSMSLPLIGAGFLLGIAPFGPNEVPDPEIILVAVLAPLVFGEALGSSYLDLRKVARPVFVLAIGLVIFSTFAVGFVGYWVAALPIAVAMALGAVLAPTDAVSVGTIAKRASLPRRLVSILEGESLVNDGTGLTAHTTCGLKWMKTNKNYSAQPYETSSAHMRSSLKSFHFTILNWKSCITTRNSSRLD